MLTKKENENIRIASYIIRAMMHECIDHNYIENYPVDNFITSDFIYDIVKLECHDIPISYEMVQDIMDSLFPIFICKKSIGKAKVYKLLNCQ